MNRSAHDTDTRHRLGEYYIPDWLAEPRSTSLLNLPAFVVLMGSAAPFGVAIGP